MVRTRILTRRVKVHMASMRRGSGAATLGAVSANQVNGVPSSSIQSLTMTKLFLHEIQITMRGSSRVPNALLSVKYGRSPLLPW